MIVLLSLNRHLCLKEKRNNAMRQLSTIDTELMRLLKGRSQLTMDFNNKVIDLTREVYDARIKEMGLKIDNLQKERKAAEAEILRKREQNW